MKKRNKNNNKKANLEEFSGINVAVTVFETTLSLFLTVFPLAWVKTIQVKAYCGKYMHNKEAEICVYMFGFNASILHHTKTNYP